MHWFDILVVVIIICSLLKGFSGGLIMQVSSLLGLVVGVIFAGVLAVSIEPRLTAWFSIESHIASPLSFLVAFLLIYIALIFVGKILHRFVKAIQLGFLNRIAGSVFCCVKWLVITSVLVNIVVRLDHNSVILKEDTRQNSQLYPPIKNLVTYIVPYLRFEKQEAKAEIPNQSYLPL